MIIARSRNGQEMKSGFSSINFHTVTVERYKGFCKKFKQTYTYTLEHMMDFFDHYQLSPMMEFGDDMLQMETNLKKRINGLVAIIKDIEKHQTKPTTSMMQLLFEHSPKKTTSPRLVEKKQKQPTDDFFKTAMEAIELERKHTELQQQHARTREEFSNVLERVRIQKNFGKTRFVLDLDPKEFEVLKTNYKTH